MRKFVVFASLLAWVAITGWAQNPSAAGSETLLRWQFAGTKQIGAIENLKTFREVLALPETQALRETVANHLARRAAARFSKSSLTNVNPELVHLIQPFLPDLWLNQSHFRMTTKGAQDADWILALKLEAGRSEEWNKMLSQLAKSAEMEGASADKKEWTARRDTYRLSFSRSRDWTILEGGYGEPDAKIARDFRSSLNRRAGRQLLDAEINGSLLAKIWDAKQLAHAPKLSLKAEPRGDGIRSELLIDYPENLGIKNEDWKVPVELIREPLIAFTAVQGVKERLVENETFRSLGAEKTPNQLFYWAQQPGPGSGLFSMFLAGEVLNPAQVVTNAGRVFADAKLAMGKLEYAKSRPALLWLQLPPPIVPYLEAAEAPHSGFAVAGLFPLSKQPAQKAPSELLAQLKKKNLVYYEWELTGPRLTQLHPLWQVYHIIGSRVPSISAPSAKWTGALKPMLGNSATEGTLENPRRIKVVRQSQLGLNALELLLLAHRLDDTDLQTQRAPRNQKSDAPPALP